MAVPRVEAHGVVKAPSTPSGLFDRLDDPLDAFQLLPRDIDPDPKLSTSFVPGPGGGLETDPRRQGSDRIGRIASARVRAKFEPGFESATAAAAVDNERRDAFRIDVGYETNGAALDGSGATMPSRLNLDLSRENLVGFNDASRLSYAGGLDSNEVRAAFSLPFRRLDLSVDASYSEPSAGISSWVEMFSRGGSLSGTLGYLIHRDPSHQVTLSSTVSWRHSERYVDGAGLAPEIVSFGRVGFSETRSFETMQASYGAGLVHGLSRFGAIDDPPEIGRAVPRAQFWKIDGNASLVKALPEIGTARLDLNAQWSAHPLYSGDQLVLGSVATVRGFTTNAAHADRGLVLRSEFAPVLPVDTILGEGRDEWLFLAEALSGLQPYLFADYGFGHDIANRETVQRAGIGAGLRYRHGRVSLDVSVGEPMFRRGGERPRNWQSPEAYLTVSVKLL